MRQCLGSPVRIGRHPRRAGLHGDRGDVMGDDIVQVAGDPQPLLGDRLPIPRLGPFVLVALDLQPVPSDEYAG